MGKWHAQNRDAFNALWRSWYRKNSKRKLAWQKRRRDELIAWWQELKATKSCEECGESAPECLHFHHKDPTTKRFSLADAANAGRPKATILAEVAKCRVLCANCHAKHHWMERNETGRGDRI